MKDYLFYFFFVFKAIISDSRLFFANSFRVFYFKMKELSESLFKKRERGGNSFSSSFFLKVSPRKISQQKLKKK